MLKNLMKKILDKRPHRFVESGFTLAEVLITLGIIGIVAAMTIPTLVANYQKTQTVTQLKKTFSTFSQVYTRAINDYGDAGSWDWSNDNTKRFAETYVLPYLSVAKNCGSDINSCSKTDKKMLNGDEFKNHYTIDYAVILSDGTQCFFSYGGYLFQITVDINGDKKPNVVGKDIFLMRMFDTSRKDVYQWTNDNRLCFVDPGLTRDYLITANPPGCNKNSTGEYCGALIQMDGWKISDDYPWN